MDLELQLLKVAAESDSILVYNENEVKVKTQAFAAAQSLSCKGLLKIQSEQCAATSCFQITDKGRSHVLSTA